MRAAVALLAAGVSVAIVTAVIAAGCGIGSLSTAKRTDDRPQPTRGASSTAPDLRAPRTKSERLAAAAASQVGKTLVYDPSYVRLRYPGGDVPIDRGVCTDVLIRAFRTLDIDLQVLVHKDMGASLDSYPNHWGLTRPDPNIDHRRVPNLATFFRRRGKTVAITRRDADYLPGDIVTWKLSNGRPHIGIVSRIRVEGADRFQIVHNIGTGARLEDALFDFEITGHYRYF